MRIGRIRSTLKGLGTMKMVNLSPRKNYFFNTEIIIFKFEIFDEKKCRHKK